MTPQDRARADSLLLGYPVTFNDPENKVHGVAFGKTVASFTGVCNGTQSLEDQANGWYRYVALLDDNSVISTFVKADSRYAGDYAVYGFQKEHVSVSLD